VDVLINTYWVRFDHRLFSHERAVANTKTLFQAAREARVRRIVHISITNPDSRSPLPYFSGKAELESALARLGVSYCILRPTVLFGKEDVLINNIAWSLRHLPVFGVFGSGHYRLQPICVEDLATLAIQGARGERNEVVNAIGPDTFTYKQMVEAIKEQVGSRSRIICLPPALAYWGCRVIGWLVRDVVITREEIRGLMEEQLYVDAVPAGTTRLTDWMACHKSTLGRHYTSEMARRLDRIPR
jgi:NADH dehydrogenase